MPHRVKTRRVLNKRPSVSGQAEPNKMTHCEVLKMSHGFRKAAPGVFGASPRTPRRRNASMIVRMVTGEVLSYLSVLKMPRQAEPAKHITVLGAVSHTKYCEL